jgi:periplasmic divalent cation tolerance protein
MKNCLENEKLILLYTTFPDESSAEKISLTLLNAKLCACTNLINGMKSTYWWEDKLESSQEIILIIKTRAELSGPCQEMILKHHPYSLPCILELPIVGGHPAYLKWLSLETAPNSTKT